VTKEEFSKVIQIISTHPDGEGEYCDTGEDMEWGCRSGCVDLAINRLERYFSDKLN